MKAKTKSLKELQVGDKVLAADNQGNLVLSDFLMFMDQDQQTVREFYVLETDEPRHRLTLTPAHLVFVMNNNTNSGDIRAMFSTNVKLGQQLLVFGNEQPDHLIPARVSRVYVEQYEGSYAPVTSHGTIIVDQVLASCYAVFTFHFSGTF
uniref:Hint domain-containing protein n=1 Tax=Lates calcarifer TaxID=8187 RepID=A0A4W6D2H2_LATCA